MKKKLSIPSDSKPFVIYHSLIILLALIAVFVSPRKISTNFMDVIPNNGISESMAKAEKAFTSSQNSSVNVFVSSQDFDRAKDAAEKLYSELNASGLFEKISLESSSIDIDALRAFVNENVYLLLDEETCQAIENNPEEFQDDSLASIFSAFTVSSMDNLGNDPFMLSERVWMNFLEKVTDSTTISPKDGVLATQLDGEWYVMINGTLTPQAMNIAKTSGGVGTVFEIGDRYIGDGVSVYYSGVPFHSFESASASQKEITWITVVSIAAILLLFFIVCKNVHILKLFAVSLVLSLSSAFATLLIFFKNFHVMTLIFGTSLIGTCIDYSIHFFVRYARRNPDEEDGFCIQRRLFKSLTLGFVSTELCYLLLLASPYPILKQIAAFSAGGLLSSYLTALFLYPKFISEKMVNRSSVIVKVTVSRKSKTYLYYVALFATVLFITQIPNLKIHNNISDLYTPSERLMKGETVFANVMGYTETTYAIIESDSENGALEDEVAFTRGLDELRDKNVLQGYLAASSYLPSISLQKRSIEACKKLLPLLDIQAEIIGLSEEETNGVRNAIENLEPGISPQSLNDSIGSLLSSISLGKVGDRFYQVVMIRNASQPDEIAKLADGFENIVYFQTSKDISRQLDELTRIIFILFAIALAIIVVALVVIFGFKQGLKMALSPYSVIVCTVAMAPVFGLALDFFFVVGLVLVIGLGLDYIVFASEKKQSSPVSAITLSFVTTELSFGSLLLSSFKPVHIFGLTVFTGILIAYICAMTSGGSCED